MPHAGRPSKFTPETKTEILKRLKEGYCLKSAARLAGVSYSITREWCHEFPAFLAQVRATQQEAAKIKVRLNPRPLARARYEHDYSPDQLAIKFADEIMRAIREGRVPFDCALRGLEIASDMVYDKLAEESLSYADDVTARVHAGVRGITEQIGRLCEG